MMMMTTDVDNPHHTGDGMLHGYVPISSSSACFPRDLQAAAIGEVVSMKSSILSDKKSAPLSPPPPAHHHHAAAPVAAAGGGGGAAEGVRKKKRRELREEAAKKEAEKNAVSR